MIEQFLYDHVWVAIGLWVAVYISDYTLTLRGARLYQEIGKKYREIDGSYELTPSYQRDINALRRFSPRFLASLWIYALILAVFWALAVYLKTPEVFALVLGGPLLLEVVVHLRHVRNIAEFTLAGPNIDGKIKMPRWVSYRLSAVELTSFSAVYLLLFVATGSWFFVGGIVACLSTGYRHWRLSNKMRAASSVTLSTLPSASTLPRE